jgi:hypothetical protein
MFNWLRRAAGRREVPGSSPLPGSGLHLCDGCHTDFVHPLEWREADGEHWWMRLRCGSCFREREITVSDAEAQRFGRDLDAAEAEIGRALAALDHERMQREADAFAAALERDLIDADDFARPVRR